MYPSIAWNLKAYCEFLTIRRRDVASVLPTRGAWQIEHPSSNVCEQNQETYQRGPAKAFASLSKPMIPSYFVIWNLASRLRMQCFDLVWLRLNLYKRSKGSFAKAGTLIECATKFNSLSGGTLEGAHSLSTHYTWLDGCILYFEKCMPSDSIAKMLLLFIRFAENAMKMLALCSLCSLTFSDDKIVLYLAEKRTKRQWTGKKVFIPREIKRKGLAMIFRDI